MYKGTIKYQCNSLSGSIKQLPTPKILRKHYFLSHKINVNVQCTYHNYIKRCRNKVNPTKLTHFTLINTREENWSLDFADEVPRTFICIAIP